VRVACGADRGWGAKKSISVALRIDWLWASTRQLTFWLPQAWSLLGLGD
jgi:hypothetical protein